MDLNKYLNNHSQASFRDAINAAGRRISQGRISQWTREGVPGDWWLFLVQVSNGDMTVQALAEERANLRKDHAA